MKNLVVVLASAVVAGLATYALLEWQGLLGLQTVGNVVIAIPAFVGTLAAVGLCSAALALLMRRSLEQGIEKQVKELEQRLQRAEAAATAPLAARPAPQPPAQTADSA